jgi:myo-inositol-1(or 4)-monophosphatase
MHTMSWLLHMEQAFFRVRQFLLSGGLEHRQVVGRNSKGDPMLGFDLAAEKAVVEYFRCHLNAPLRIIGEEQGIIDLGHGRRDFVIIIDPVDGSWNCSRGMELGAFSAALIPAGSDFRIESVLCALTGQLFTGTVYTAERGKGARRNGLPIHSSPLKDISEAVIGCDFTLPAENRWKIQRVSNLFRQARRLVSLGSAVTELSLVASGALDAHVDVRDELSGENFLGPAMIIIEAGGIVTGPSGMPLPALRSLNEKTSLVASGNPVLHKTILQSIQLDKDLSVDLADRTRSNHY